MVTLLNKLKTDNKGSYTVEACLAATTVLFVLFAVIFSFLFLVQKAMLSEAAGHCAQKGAEIWIADTFNAYTANGLTDGYKTSLYYRISDFKETDSRSINIAEALDKELEAIEGGFRASRGNEKKMNWIKYAAYSRLGRCIMRPEKTNVEIAYQNDFIKSQVQVTITQEVKIPFGFIKALFDGKDTLTLRATGTAAVAEPAEYIRNLDLTVEYGKRLAGKLDSVLEKLSSEASKE